MESWEVGGLEGVLNKGQRKPMNHHKVLGEGKEGGARSRHVCREFQIFCLILDLVINNILYK